MPIHVRPRRHLDGAVDERVAARPTAPQDLDDFLDFVYHTLIMRVHVSHPVGDVPARPGAPPRRLRRGDGTGRGQGPLAEARARALGRADRAGAARPVPAPRPQLSQTRPPTSATSTGAARIASSRNSRRSPVPSLRLLLAGDTSLWTTTPHDALAASTACSQARATPARARRRRRRARLVTASRSGSLAVADSARGIRRPAPRGLRPRPRSATAQAAARRGPSPPSYVPARTSARRAAQARRPTACRFPASRAARPRETVAARAAALREGVGSD